MKKVKRLFVKHEKKNAKRV